MRCAVITIASGRTTHLRNQIRGLARTDHHDHIVVAMGDRTVTAVAEDNNAHTVFMDAGSRLPLASARNLGARAALGRGADLLIFLDVDCIPSPELLRRYRESAAPGALLCGPVTYLPPPSRSGYDLRRLSEYRDPHPARPDPPNNRWVDTTDFDLFWSLSFAVTAETWRSIGGFSTRYRGYGGEDTDFARKAACLDAHMRWVGGADAYHQYHPVSDPPIEHLADILRNAEIFHRRWGSWPMHGWLDDFAAMGLIHFDPAGQRWIADQPSQRSADPASPNQDAPRTSVRNLAYG